jgi:hypothetical protein
VRLRNYRHNLLLLCSNDKQSRPEWRDHEEVQHYASTAVVRLVQAELSPSEVKGRSPQLQRNKRCCSGQTHWFCWLAVQVQVLNLDKGVVPQRQLRALYSVLFTSNWKFTQSEPSSQSQSDIYSAGRDNRDVGDAHYRQLEADNGLK